MLFRSSGRLSRKDNTLKFVPMEDDGNGIEREGQPRYIPVETVDQFYVFGSLDVNSALYNFLGQNDIVLHFFDYYENYTGSLMPRNTLLSGRMILAQTKAFQDKKRRMAIARQLIHGAAYNMQKNLQYYNRQGKDMEPLLERTRLT